MRRSLWLLVLCLVSLTFVTGCSKKEEPVSIQKRIGTNTYRFEAYKEKIDMNKTEKPKEVLENAKWKENMMDKTGPKADFIFYFNDREFGNKVVTYFIWVNADESTVEVTKEDQNKYVLLNEKDSEVILDFIQ